MSITSLIPLKYIPSFFIDEGMNVIGAKGSEGKICEITTGKNLNNEPSVCFWIFWRNDEDRLDERVSCVAHDDCDQIKVEVKLKYDNFCP